MPQEQLDRPDIAPRFKQVRRNTMAQGMDAVAVRDPRGPLGMRGDAESLGERVTSPRVARSRIVAKYPTFV